MAQNYPQNVWMSTNFLAPAWTIKKEKALISQGLSTDLDFVGFSTGGEIGIRRLPPKAGKLYKYQ
jgi:hypothetical protein